MTTSTSRLALTICLAATLALSTACGQQEASDAAPATAPVATDLASTTADAAPTTDGPEESEPEASQDAGADESSEDADASGGDASGGAGQGADARLLDVAAQPEWTAPGELLGVYGDVAVVMTESLPGPGEAGGEVTVTAYRADGTAAWERELTVPDALVGAEQVTAQAAPGHRHVLLTWTGTPAGSDHGLVVAVVVDPATGADVATGEVEAPAGLTVYEQFTYDTFWLSDGDGVLPDGNISLTVDADGPLAIDPGSDGYDEEAKGTHWSVTHDLWVEVDYDDGRLQVLTEDGPLGEGGTCDIPPGPGVMTALGFSPSRDLAIFPGAVVNLVDGSVTCSDEVVEGRAQILTDDGLVTVAEPALSDWGYGILGDLLINQIDEGVAAHRTS